MSGICFAVEASSALKPLFPVCLADSQNNQELCVIVLLALEKRLECTFFPLFLASLTLMARSVALFPPFLLPHFTLFQIKVMRLLLLPPTGVCEEVFRSFTSVEA